MILLVTAAVVTAIATIGGSLIVARHLAQLRQTQLRLTAATMELSTTIKHLVVAMHRAAAREDVAIEQTKALIESNRQLLAGVRPLPRTH